jgi:hypothetical protein
MGIITIDDRKTPKDYYLASQPHCARNYRGNAD